MVYPSEAVMRLHEMVSGIQSKADLLMFLQEAAEDLRTHPEEWENNSLERYLSALANWLTEPDAYYRSKGSAIPVTPTWQTFAEMLIAAKTYE
jgi:hypothetical protein